MNVREKKRSEWIAGVSHDIRTPLSIVLGNAEKGSVTEKQCLRIRELVNNLNTENKLEMGTGKWQKDKIKMAELVREMICDFINAGGDIYEWNMEIDPEYISFDNEAVGRLMGEALVQAGVTDGKVLILSGPTTDNNVSMVNEGFIKTMQENGNEIVDIMYADNWRPEYASEYIYGHPEVLDEIDAIMCGNDNLATHAIRVLAEKRKAGEILVTGQDADLEACQRIVEGTQLMTVYKPVEVQARTAAECTIELIKGNMPDAVNVNISDGTYTVPGIVLDPVAVTADNMDAAIIDSGFHLREDVYLNIGEDNN